MANMAGEQSVESRPEDLPSTTGDSIPEDALLHLSLDRDLTLALDLGLDLDLTLGLDLDLPLDLDLDMDLDMDLDLDKSLSSSLDSASPSLPRPDGDGSAVVSEEIHSQNPHIDQSLIDPALVGTEPSQDSLKAPSEPSSGPSQDAELSLGSPQSHQPSTSPLRNKSHKPKEGKLRPDPGYVKMYEDYTRTYFSCDYLEIPSHGKLKSMHRLKPSKITTSKAYYVDQVHPKYAHDGIDTSIDETKKPEAIQFAWLPGSWWSAEEKETFFRCLARYSIHRVGEWCYDLPNKSEAEILMYYHLLHLHLSRMKRTKRFKVSFEDYLPNKDSELFLVPHIYESDFHFKGASYASLPIAYELTEEWIKYEEAQASILSLKEDSQTRRIELARKRKVAGLQQDMSDEDLLLNKLAAVKLSNIFRKNSIFPSSKHSSNQMNIDVLLLLEKFVRQKLREIIGNLISQRECGDAEEGPKVTTTDVWKTCLALKMFQTPRAGVYSRDRDGKLPILASYWKNIVLSLLLVVEGDLPRTEKENRAGDYKKLITEKVFPIIHVHSQPSEENTLLYDLSSVDFTAQGEILENGDVALEDDTSNVLGTADFGTGGELLTKKRSFNDALVEEMCFQQETSTLRILDSKNDQKQFEKDMKYFEKLQLSSLEKAVPALDFEDLDNIRFWGPTNVEKLCPEKLRSVWDHSFAQYAK